MKTKFAGATAPSYQRERERRSAGGGLNKLVTFALDDQVYAVAADITREIFRLVAINPLPDAPDFVPGIINLRGKIVPLIDMRLRFGLPFRLYRLDTPIIIVNTAACTVGLIVDRVCEVVNIDPAEISVDDVVSRHGYLRGVAKHDRRLILLIDVDQLLTFHHRRDIKRGLSEADENKTTTEDFKSPDICNFG